MKTVKNLVVALAVAATVAPAHAELSTREMLGIAGGAFLGYQLMKEPHRPAAIGVPYGGHVPGLNAPYHGMPVPVGVSVLPPGFPHTPVHVPSCVVRQGYSAPGQGGVYVQECRF